jgi:hypothetical protein
MEPLTPQDRERILENPDAAPADLDEYELLLSERFTIDPDLSPEPFERSEAERIEARLAELHRKLFPRDYREPGA